MAKRLLFLLVIALTCATLAACGESEPEVDVQATEVAAGVAATLTAQAPLPTLVVTPPPPTSTVAPRPTEASSDPMNIRLEADGSGEYASLQEAQA